MQQSILEITLSKYANGQLNSLLDAVAVEEPLEMRLTYTENNQPATKNISVTMRTPGNDEELASGFLFTEGIIKRSGDINHVLAPGENVIEVVLNPNVTIAIEKLNRHFYTTSSCGVCGKSSIDAIKTVSHTVGDSIDSLQVTKEVILSLVQKLNTQQGVFAVTGGLHASALFTGNGDLLMVKEDVGRHNALDKLIGTAMKENLLPLTNHILLLSGRASFELIQKAVMAQLKMVVAVGAPSSLAVQLALEYDVSLIGFLREERFNVYCGEKRVS
jgi:FdhD protein